MPDNIPDPFEYITFRGKVVDRKTALALEVAEARLGYELTVVQGHNPGGVVQSGGTHDGGGTVDLAPFDWKRKVRVLRDLGFAAWYRPAIRGLWGAHIHAVLIEHGRLSWQAAAQVVKYLAGWDGLSGYTKDPNPYRPSPAVVFSYRAALRDERLRERIVTMKGRVNALQDRISAAKAEIQYKIPRKKK